MKKKNDSLQQSKSQTSFVAQPDDVTQAGNQSEVALLNNEEQEEETVPLHPLINDKDYPAGVREWMMTAPGKLKFPTLSVVSSMLAVYATRVRLNYVVSKVLVSHLPAI